MVKIEIRSSPGLVETRKRTMVRRGTLVEIKSDDDLPSDVRRLYPVGLNKTRSVRSGIVCRLVSVCSFRSVVVLLVEQLGSGLTVGCLNTRFNHQ